jgi:hypothetical protein
MNSLYKGNPSLDSYNVQINQVLETEQQAVTICNSTSFITQYTAAEMNFVQDVMK